MNIKIIFITLVLLLETPKHAQGNSDDELLNAGGEKRPRHHHGACKIVLNEIYFGNKKDSFIEVSKVCGRNAIINSVTELKGYAVLLIIKQDEQFTCVKSEKLFTKQLRDEQLDTEAQHQSVSVTQPDSGSRTMNALRDHHRQRTVSSGATLRRKLSKTPGEHKPRQKFKVIINPLSTDVAEGTQAEPNSGSSTRSRRSNTLEAQTNAKMFYSVEMPEINYFEEGIAIVLLLHIHSAAARSSLPCTVGSAVTDTDITEIKRWIYDIIVLSSTSLKDTAVSFVEKIIPPKNNVQEIYDIVIQLLPAEDQSLTKINGFSKCDAVSKPRIPQGFKLAPPTKNSKNMCPVDKPFMLKSVVEFPFWFKGKEFVPQSNQLIINLVRSLAFYQNNELYMKQEPKQLAALLLNIALKSVQKAERKLKQNTINIPKKKRAVPSKLMTFMEDENNKHLLRDTITSFYKQNKVPTVMMLHKEFTEKVKRAQLECVEKSGPVGDCEDTVELFTCHQETFRKLLHKEGYKFGALNHRYSVLFDPDKVRWRRKYLTKIREVRQQNKLEIVYLDETWIDPNMLPKKGWIAKTCKDPREKAEFAYNKVKPGRGPRLIVLACGGKNGFITGSNLVWAINAKDADRDYHGNVNQELFEKWFNGLLDNLDKTGKKYFIVIDNAPYHSVLNAPKQTARKSEIIEFMRAEKAKGIYVPDHYDSMLLIDLKKTLKEMKASKSYYRIDSIAKERGHIVARIPAFNCDLNPIESVWKDLKFKIMQENRDQNIDVLLQKTMIALNTYEKQKWENHEKHIQKIEQSYWESDEKFDLALANNNDIAYEEDINENVPASECILDDDSSEVDDEDESSNENDNLEAERNTKKPKLETRVQK